jgi:hypothetical protein
VLCASAGILIERSRSCLRRLDPQQLPALLLGAHIAPYIWQFFTAHSQPIRSRARYFSARHVGRTQAGPSRGACCMSPHTRQDACASVSIGWGERYDCCVLERPLPLPAHGATRAHGRCGRAGGPRRGP